MSSTSPKPVSPSGWKTARSVFLCGASVRSLAESVIAAGFHPLCVDFFEDEDLKEMLGSGRGRFVGRIKAFREIPQVIRSIRRTIPLLWAGGMENHTNVLRDISQTRTVIGADPDIVDQLRDPWRLQRWLLEAGVNIPRLATEATADADCHWLRKSVTSSGGLGIGQVSTTRQGISEILSPDVYLQEYIDGVPMSATFCADDSGLQMFGMCLQLIGWPCLGASDFLFCGNVGPVDVGEEITKQVLAIARVLVDGSGIRGVFGIDFILRQGRVWLLEVNPRLTASHILFELQQPGLLVQRHLEAHGWKSSKTRRMKEMPKSRLLQVPTPVSARLIFWAKEDVEFTCQREPQGASLRFLPIRIADCPQAGSIVAKSSPLCSLHVTASDFKNIERQLTALEAGPDDKKRPSIADLFKMGFLSQAIAGQLRLLRQKFERNLG